jgi:glycosyltransferase involved in cell wall biosynthesis
VGKHNKSYYEANGLKQNQLIYAPHAIDNYRFLDSSGKKRNQAQKWRENLGFLKDDFVLLYAGKLEPRKNLFFLVNLMKAVEDDNLKLLIIGNGPLENELQAKFREDKRVAFLGFINQSEMPISYRVSNFFILPSVNETWGLSINEALACGTPVLASNKCGGAIDLINKTNGLIFDPINGINEVVKYLKSKKYCIFNNRSLLQGHDYNDIVKAVVLEINQMKFKQNN